MCRQDMRRNALLHSIRPRRDLRQCRQLPCLSRGHLPLELRCDGRQGMSLILFVGSLLIVAFLSLVLLFRWFLAWGIWREGHGRSDSLSVFRNVGVGVVPGRVGSVPHAIIVSMSCRCR